MMMRYALRALLLVVFLLAGVQAVAGETETPTKKKAPSYVPLGRKAPPLPDHGWLGGPPLTLAQARGKLVLFYFFQPGCGSCDEFTLHLRRLQRKYRDGFIAIGIADRTEEEIEKVSGGVNNIYRFLRDPGGIYRRKLLGGIDILPSYALLDEDGRLVWVDQGQYRLPFALEVEQRLSKRAERVSDPEGTFRAVVVGASRDPLTGTKLEYPVRDAHALAKALRAAGCSQVRLLTDQEENAPACRAEPDRIRAAVLSSVRQSKRGDQILFFFSGSGLQRGKGLSFDIDLLMGSKEEQKNLSLRRITSDLAAAPCPTLSLIDIGHEDAHAAPYRDLTNTLDKVFDGTMLFFACNGMSPQSRPMPEGFPGTGSRFTYCIRAALTGAADANDDDLVSARELFRYVWLHVNNINRQADTKQVPFAVNLTADHQPVFNVPSHPPATPSAHKAVQR